MAKSLVCLWARVLVEHLVVTTATLLEKAWSYSRSDTYSCEQSSQCLAIVAKRLIDASSSDRSSSTYARGICCAAAKLKAFARGRSSHL